MKGDIGQLQVGATRYELEEVWIQQVSSEAFGARTSFLLVASVHNKEAYSFAEGVSMIWFMDLLALVKQDGHFLICRVKFA